MELVEINNYWLSRFWRLELDYPTCFVCGTEKRLERCHLIPKSLGGSDNVDNLVLLCKEHHAQAPNISLSKDIMLKWIEEETETYDVFFHMKKDDLQKWVISFAKIHSRIKSVMGDDFNNQDLIDFILCTYKDNSVSVGSHPQANMRTRVMLVEYMSEYKDLETDYLKYLLRKNKII